MSGMNKVWTSIYQKQQLRILLLIRNPISKNGTKKPRNVATDTSIRYLRTEKTKY